MDKVILMVTGSNGQFVPETAIKGMIEYGWTGISEKDAETLLLGPTYVFSQDKRPGYWDAWERVLNNASWTDPESLHEYKLHQGEYGDLWAYDVTLTEEELREFFD